MKHLKIKDFIKKFKGLDPELKVVIDLDGTGWYAAEKLEVSKTKHGETVFNIKIPSDSIKEKMKNLKVKTSKPSSALNIQVGGEHYKNGKQDLEKIIRYIELIIELEYPKTSSDS